MPSPAQKSIPLIEDFDEKQFYLDEFRGHTLLFSIPVEELADDSDYECLGAMIRDLLINGTRVLVLIGAAGGHGGEQLVRRVQRRLGPLVFRDETLPLFPPRQARGAVFQQLESHLITTAAATIALVAAVWSLLRRAPLFVGVVEGTERSAVTEFAPHLAGRLRVHKLILVEPEGGVSDAAGKKLSFMDESMLATLLRAGEAEWVGLASRRATFDAVRTALLSGVGSVNLCSLSGAARELFTYEGSGTLFTLRDYCTVERLGIDDFEEVERLIERGQREGLLKPRTAEEVAGMLTNGYGATIGAHHLAGICALTTELYTAERAGELVGLYTITRFKGEGVGDRLVGRVIKDARDAGLAYVFACTTEARAQAFFERQGFRRVSPDAVPAAKWVAYDPQRKAQVAVFRFDL